MTARPLAWISPAFALLSACAAATSANAQIAPPTQPTCNCGPSAMPAYIPSPQPALRPLDYSPRANSAGTNMSGVTYREGATYRPARTDLGASASPPYVGPALWSGAYAGVHGGYGSGSARLDDIDLGSMTNSGWFGGAHVGYLAQTGAIVFGIEGDIGTGAGSGRKMFMSGVTATADRNWTASLRGRLGYAFGDVLLYGTGGVALTQQELNVAYGGLQSGGKTTFPGFVLGGGIEWKALRNVSLRGEVLHYTFGSRDLDLNGYKVPTKLDDTVVRAGVTYHFN